MTEQALVNLRQAGTAKAGKAGKNHPTDESAAQWRIPQTEVTRPLHDGGREPRGRSLKESASRQR